MNSSCILSLGLCGLAFSVFVGVSLYPNESLFPKSRRIGSTLLFFDFYCTLTTYMVVVVSEWDALCSK